ncbi:hypothetical protein KKG81_12980 [bacterium]|nr:hypothetical protein [bacterium]
MKKWPMIVNGLITAFLCTITFPLINRILEGAQSKALVFIKFIIAVVLSLILPVILIILDETGKKSKD